MNWGNNTFIIVSYLPQVQVFGSFSTGLYLPTRWVICSLENETSGVSPNCGCELAWDQKHPALENRLCLARILLFVFVSGIEWFIHYRAVDPESSGNFKQRRSTDDRHTQTNTETFNRPHTQTNNWPLNTHTHLDVTWISWTLESVSSTVIGLSCVWGVACMAVRDVCVCGFLLACLLSGDIFRVFVLM